jgi:2-polyprenyl-6-hydroxyphenyl methylase / 3-demethylubiquinone-9 3-methyltransferase
LEVLEHVTDVHSIIRSVSELLDPTNGIFVVSTINSTWKAYGLAVVGAESIMGYLPPGTHDPSKFQSPSQVEQVIQRYGMEPAGPPMGMILSGLPPPMGPWRWTLSATDLDVNWIACYRHRKRE